MTEPRLSPRGGNGRAYVSSEFDVPPKKEPLLDRRGITTGVLVVLVSALVSAGFSFFGTSAQAANQSREAVESVKEVKSDLAELRRRQVQADLDAARLAGNYEAVVRGVDQRLELMQQQLNRIESKR